MLPENANRRCRAFASSRIVIARAVSLPILGGMFAYTNYFNPGLASHSLGSALIRQPLVRQVLPRPVPEFPRGGPSPAGDIGLDAVQFQPLDVNYGILPGIPLQISVNGETMTLSVGSPFPSKETQVVWSGPSSQARFTVTTLAGVHSLTDANGQVVWSNAAERAHPDILIEKQADGTALLRTREGAAYRTGPLPAGAVRRTASFSSHNGAEVWQTTIAGLQIESRDGAGTITDEATKQVVWRGSLSPFPTILTRDGIGYTFSTGNRGEGGTDRTANVQFASEMGQMTITDLQNKVVGVLPIPIVKITRQQTYKGRLMPGPEPMILSPMARLSTDGTAFLTYRDTSGRIFRRAKVYQQDNRQGFMASG